jgi:roadblock/LC7 domain-containing protein
LIPDVKDVVWAAVESTVYVRRSQFFDGWETMPHTAGGGLVGAVLTKGPELHFVTFGKKWRLTRADIKKYLEPILAEHGRVETRTPKEDARQRRADAVDAARIAHPVLGAVFEPVVRFRLWNEDLDSDVKGIDGESAVSRALRRLPASWCCIDNVVLSAEADGYAQVDHVAVGPSGVYAIETKNWSGALHGSRDVWRRKQGGGGWKKVGSPTAQSGRHARRIEDHLRAYGLEVPVIPVVVFVAADWLRWDNCTGLIFEGAGRMRESLARLQGNALPSQDGRVLVAERIALGVRPSAADEGSPASAAEADTPLPPPHEPAAPPPLEGAARPASPKQRAYVRELLTRAHLPFSDERVERMTSGEAQAVIDRLRFRRPVELPPLG